MMPRRITGIDGKSYPARPLRGDDRDWLIGRCHWLKHDEAMSVREIRDHLLYNHNLGRSVGSISSYLAQPCTECSGGAFAAPEQSAVVA